MIVLNHAAFQALGQFVTAKIKDVEDYRQGIVTCVYQDGTFFLTCESDDAFICEGDPTIVPYKNLLGSTKDWYDGWHKTLR